MHGRLKVKTTAEKEAEKNKIREKKKQVYLKCMNKIKGMYNSGDRSVDLLNIITKVLENIPEFSTLWNWRRVVLLDIFSSCSDVKQEKESETVEKESETLEKESESEATCEREAPNKAAMILSEKLFVARCLEVNPKAYSLWSHRRWLVEQNTSECVIKEELNLCNLFLKYDARNFHCWDYRRFIVKLGGIKIESELEMSTSLIERNFSNYSAWHYRTTLLDTQDMGVVREELEWAQNAYFTDPSDQSVWLYYQWLLGRETQEDKLLAVYRDTTNSTINLLLNNLTYTAPSNIQIQENTDKSTNKSTDKSNVTWNCHSFPAKLWWCDATHLSDNVTVRLGGATVTLCSGDTLGVVPGGISPRINYTAPQDIVQEQLGNIRELYELEPDNKWVILTYLDMVNTCNPHKTKEQITEIRNLTVKLCHVDTMRTGYYRDLWTKLLCETAVTAWWANMSRDITSRDPLNLSKKYITKLGHSEYMFALRELDLSHNNLTSLAGFSSLVAVEKVNLSHNKLHSLQGLEECKNLTELDASHNLIHNACGILSCTKCRLRALCLLGNPLATSSVYPGCVVQSCPMLCLLDNREL